MVKVNWVRFARSKKAATSHVKRIFRKEYGHCKVKKLSVKRNYQRKYRGLGVAGLKLNAYSIKATLKCRRR